MKRLLSRSALIWTGGAAAAALLGFLAIGPAGLVLAGIALVLALVWKFDNWSGSCFMLTVLGLIAVAVPMLLLALVALRR
jgi:hypothetical protein